MIAKSMSAKKWLRQILTVIGYISFTVVFAVLILWLNPASIIVAPSDARASIEGNKIEAQPTGFEKEAIASIREITLQLILVTGGIYALVGGFVASKSKSKSKSYHCKWVIHSSFIILALSIALGFLAYGGLIFDLSGGTFHVAGTAQQMAARQWLTFFIGGLLLVVFLARNID